MIRAVRAIVGKEFRELSRDPVSLGLALGLPIVMLVLYGYGLNLDIQPVRLGVFDLDQSARSRDYLASITASGDLRLAQVANRAEDIGGWLDRGQIDIGLIVPTHFEQTLLAGQPAAVQVLVDASSPPQAEASLGQLDAATDFFSFRLIQAAVPDAMSHGVVAIPRVWFNPELRSANYIVPGLFSLILMTFAPLLSTLAIVREREHGSIQQILVAPVSPAAFIVGKALPYAVLAFVDLLIVVAAGVWWFHIPMRGSVPLLLSAGVVFVFCAVGLGLLISTLARSQVVAMLLAIVVTIMPSFLFSGFLFPLYSMPQAYQWVSLIFPARYFTELARAIALKATGPDVIWPQLAALVGLAAALILLTISRFNRRMS